MEGATAGGGSCQWSGWKGILLARSRALVYWWLWKAFWRAATISDLQSSYWNVTSFWLNRKIFLRYRVFLSISLRHFWSCVYFCYPPGNSHSKMGSTCSQFMENLCSPELLKNGVPHQPEIWIDFRATKKQTNKTAGFHFREDHGSAEMSILGQVANKCWIYSGDLWM